MNEISPKPHIDHDLRDELRGRYVEEIDTGMTAVFAKTVTEADIVLFAGISGDTNPVHLDENFAKDTLFIGMYPHMHMRGKDFRYELTYPDGKKEVLLDVPNYDFNWQLTYELTQPKLLPKGTVIECTAHFDNSVNNKYNPDATKEVHWGEQTWEEMMIGFFDVSVPMNKTALDLMRPNSSRSS